MVRTHPELLGDLVTQVAPTAADTSVRGTGSAAMVGGRRKAAKAACASLRSATVRTSVHLAERDVAARHVKETTAEMKPRHMWMRRSFLAVVAIAGLGGLALAAVSLGAAGRDADDHSKPDDHSVLFTQSATSGSLKSSGGKRMTLTLRGVAPQVVWFQDRPDRRAGQVSATEFVSRWRSFGFQSDAPNAALTLLGAPNKADTVVVELLRRPRYNPAQETMTYVVRELSDTSGKLGGFEDDADAAVPARFGATSLFIDAAQVYIGSIARRAAFLAAAEGAQEQMRHTAEGR